MPGNLARFQRARLGGLGELAAAVGLIRKVLDLARIADGATGLPPPGCSESCEMRPTCQSCTTILPPASCTASVTCFQPASCSGA